jgi:hypothetical protein
MYENIPPVDDDDDDDAMDDANLHPLVAVIDVPIGT